MKLREVSVDYIVQLLELELKKPFFLYYYNFALQDKTFYMIYQLFFFLFYIQDET